MRSPPPGLGPGRARWVAPTVLLLHAAALMLLWRLVAPPAPGGAARAVRLSLMAPRPTASAIPASPQERPAIERSRPPAPRSQTTATTAIAPPTEAPRAAPAEAPRAIAADEPSSEPPLLDGAATRRAIRESARNPGLAQRSDDALGNAPRDANATLREGVDKAAHGDCAKGEYVGGGMGLLSLPFWAAAELAGRCAR
ncbi:hypothetical protein [Rivibacter subsaxonicus]|uniref:Uncharacterized protein n=1 Tax=Rivibacter subsaxonicus TaxID=457575 RepID=A0A4Q7W0A2_9BURK|nr:hypothetical protein [Rivibacter subsaxonicus]RZU02510.1 hypothetical protein EV670_0536 [Rivibacter subsaxonicus]